LKPVSNKDSDFFTLVTLFQFLCTQQIGFYKIVEIAVEHALSVVPLNASARVFYKFVRV
jgi:hypothetical protein